MLYMNILFIERENVRYIGEPFRESKFMGNNLAWLLMLHFLTDG